MHLPELSRRLVNYLIKIDILIQLWRRQLLDVETLVLQSQLPCGQVVPDAKVPSEAS